MIFRIYHETLRGHVHCALFAGVREGALGKCGEFVMRVEEFEAFQRIHEIDFRLLVGLMLLPGRLPE